MKKLLNILGAVTLIGTTSTSVAACNEGEHPEPIPPVQKIDISDKITTSINLGQLSANTAAVFKSTLQTELVKIADLTTIKTSDYDVYKAGTTQLLFKIVILLVLG